MNMILFTFFFTYLQVVQTNFPVINFQSYIQLSSNIIWISQGIQNQILIQFANYTLFVYDEYGQSTSIFINLNDQIEKVNFCLLCNPIRFTFLFKNSKMVQQYTYTNTSISTYGSSYSLMSLLNLLTPPSGQIIISVFHLNTSNLLYILNNQIAIQKTTILGPSLQSLYNTSVYNITVAILSDLIYTNQIYGLLGCSGGQILFYAINTTSATVTVSFQYAHTSAIRQVFCQNGRFLTQDINNIVNGYDPASNIRFSLTSQFNTQKISQIFYQSSIPTIVYFVYETKIISAFYDSVNHNYILNQNITNYVPGFQFFLVEANQNIYGALQYYPFLYNFINLTFNSSSQLNFTVIYSNLTLINSTLNNSLIVFNSSSLLNSTSQFNWFNQTQPSQSLNTQILSIFINGLNSALSAVNSLPFCRTLLKFMSPMFGFFDDYWFYIYHDRSYDNLTISFNFLKSVYGISNTKMIPFFIQNQVQKFHQIISLEKNNNKEIYIKKSPKIFVALQNNIVQFLSNIQDMYTINYMSTLLVFLLFKGLYIVIKNTCKKEIVKHTSKSNQIKNNNSENKINPQSQYQENQCNILNTIMQYLKNQTYFFVLVDCLITPNIIYISFYAALQLWLSFQYSTFDKVNFLIMLSVYFGFFIFSLTFYFITFNKYENKCQILLQNNNFSWKSFKFYSIMLFLKSFIQGTIHGYFSDNNILQISLLITIKMTMILIVVFYRKTFKSSFYCKTYLFYFAIGIAYDFYLLYFKLIQMKLIEISSSVISIIQNGKYIEAFLISTLILITIIRVFYSIISQLKQFCIKQQKNKIQEEVANIMQSQQNLTGFQNVLNLIENNLKVKQINVQNNFCSKSQILSSKQAISSEQIAAKGLKFTYIDSFGYEYKYPIKRVKKAKLQKKVWTQQMLIKNSSTMNQLKITSCK